MTETVWKIESDIPLKIIEAIDSNLKVIEYVFKNRDNDEFIVHFAIGNQGVTALGNTIIHVMKTNFFEFYYNNTLYTLYFEPKQLTITLKVYPYRLFCSKSHPIFHDTSSNQEKILGNKTCLFCTKTNVPFDKIAHILPEGLGNRTYINVDCECDNCNSFMSRYESHLVNMLDMERAFYSGSKKTGKGQVNFIKSPLGTIKSVAGSRKLEIDLENNQFAVEIDAVSGEGQGLFKYESQGYNLEFVCKSLTHSIWSFLDIGTRIQLEHIRKWLKGKFSIYPLFLDEFIIQGTTEEDVTLEIWESNSNQTKDYPIAIRYYYGNHLLQFYLPKNIETKEPIEVENFNYGMIQLSEYNNLLLSKRHIIFNPNCKIPRETKVFNFKFKSSHNNGVSEVYNDVELIYVFSESDL